MDLISVVIPTYHRGNMLENAIESVINQTYKNIEIIVVDDNYNDNNERFKTKELEKKYPTVKFIYNTSQLGGALSRNTGILNSNGKYVAFLDDDDMFLETKLEEEYKLFKEKEKVDPKVAMIYCYKQNYNDKGEYSLSKKVDVEGNCLYEHMLNILETTSTWLCLKEALVSVGMFENVKAHQDNILLMKMLASGYTIYRVPKVLLSFYIHNGNGITKQDKKYIEYTKVLFDYKKKYYNLLKDKEIENIEYVNSSILIRFYRINNMYPEYKEEMKKVLKNNKFRLHTIKMFMFRFMMKRGGSVESN